MKGFDFLHIKAAAKGLNHVDLSHDHLTTMDIGQIQPLTCIECVPRDKHPVKARYFMRLSPLAKPTYGKVYFKTASFYVPSFMLADEAESFHAGSATHEGVSANLRFFTYRDLALFFSNVVTYVASNVDYDWTFIDVNGSPKYARFTAAGRYYLKVLNSLGYAIPTNIDLQSNSTWSTKFGTRKLNAMPLLAFCKAYNDYMSRSTHYNTSGLTALLRSIKHNVTYGTYYSNSTYCISSSGILYLLQQIKLCYENDYFLSAWQNPENPISSISTPNMLSVPGNSGDSVFTTLDDVQLQFATPSTPGGVSANLNQRSLDFLRRVDDFARRYNFSGSRTYQKILAQFGIKTSDFRSNYAELINTTSDPVQIGDITATASTYNVTYGDTYVGDYAGKGIMARSDDFNYACHDYGYLIVLGYITVAPMMAYGFDRSVLRIEKFDFYTPQFDGLGADAISFGEVYATPLPAAGDSYYDDAVYGFTERYNSYRFKRDLITGDFRNFHNNAKENCWHTGRILSSVRAAGAMVAQGDAMSYLPQFDSEFDRIFSVTTGVDNFFLTAQFDIQSMRPMESLNSVPRLGVGDTVIPKNGNAVN